MAKRDRLLYVEWEDACSHDNTWLRRETYERTNRPDRCQSVGWLIAENENAITLCANRSTTNDQLCADITIPKSAIRKRRILRHK